MTSSLLIQILGLSVFGTALAVVVPLFGARTKYLSAWVLAVATAIGTVGGALVVLAGNIEGLSFTIFPGVTFALSVDSAAGFSAVFFTLINLVACLAALFSVPYLKHYAATYHGPSVQALTALFVLGMQGVVLATSPVWFMVFWEVMSLSSFFLVLADRKPDSVRAALMYFAMTQAGALAILAGFLLLAQSPLTTFAEIAQIAPVSWISTLAFFLFLFGFGSKAGLVPFHVWLPQAHPQAPSHISALMSGVMLKVALYGFLRVIFILPVIPAQAGLVVIGFGVLSAIVGVLNAVVQPDLKKMLAYSSIENLGLMFTLVGVFLFTNEPGWLLLGVLAAVSHGVFKSGLFLSSGVLIASVHERSLEAMGGLAKRMPSFSKAFFLLVLAAAALPPFGMFFVEWRFILGILNWLSSTPFSLFSVGAIGLLALVAGVGGLAIFAMVKMFGIAMLGAPRTAHAQHAEEPTGFLLWPVWVLAVLSVLIGLRAPQFVALTAGLPISLSLTGISVQVALALTLSFALVWVVNRAVSNPKRVRYYQTWDCGQPITSGMEYTATAFSAPIRFFFRFLLRSRKTITVEPIVATNPWIVRRNFSLDLTSVWWSQVYQPLMRALYWASYGVRRVQGGRVQLYLLFIVAAVLITLMLAV